MTTANTNNKATPRGAPKRSWAWRAGAAVRTRRWPKRLAVGALAWVAFGIVTALLDPRAGGAGIIGLFGTVGYGGVAAWLAAGTGLTASALITHACYRRRGVPAALIAGALSLAAVAAFVVIVDWFAVLSVVALVVIPVGMYILLVYVLPFLIGDDRLDMLLRSAGSRFNGHYTKGPYGWGWYWRW